MNMPKVPKFLQTSKAGGVGNQNKQTDDLIDTAKGPALDEKRRKPRTPGSGMSAKPSALSNMLLIR